MSRTLITLFLLSGAIPLRAQWEALTAPTIDIWAIQAVDAQTLRAGGSGALVLSDNGGDSWDTLHTTFQGFDFPAALYDVYFSNAMNGFAVGFFSLGDQAVVARTTDGGQDWTAVYFDETGTWPRPTQAIAFPTSSVGIVVGFNGKVLRSTNSGSTWAPVASGTTARLYDVAFTSATNGCAVGENVILRTVNGGLNWTVQSVNGDLRSLSFADASNGYAIGQDNALFRTTNGGVSWQTVVPSLMPSVDLTAIHAVSTSLLYATGGPRIWRSTDSGIHWEWQPAPAAMEDIIFRDGVGFAVGAAGTILRTGDSEGPYAPSPFFTVSPAVACEDSALICTNGSAAGLTFTWLLNGEPFSTETNASVVLSAPSQSDTIGLVASNGALSDTAFRIVPVAPTLQIGLTTSVLNDTLCSGASTTIRVQGSQGGTSYRLYRGTTPLGATQAGNGGTLNFNTGPITQNDTLTIRATRTVTGCGSSTASATHILFMATPSSTTPFSAEDAALCAGESTNIVLATSALNTSYQLRKGVTPIGPPQNGTGSALSFPTGPLTSTASFTFAATHTSGCSAVLSSPATVTVEAPEANFTLSTFNPLAGVPMLVVNTSEEPGSTYQWAFGNGAVPATSNSATPPPITYGVAGAVEITFTVTSGAGCVTSHTLEATVIAPFVPGECANAVGAFDAGPIPAILGVRTDPATGSTYLFLSASECHDLRVTSGHGDTLSVHFPVEISFPTDFDRNELLVKLDSNLVPQWATKLWHGSGSPWGDLFLDSNGEPIITVYMADFLDSLRIFSTDGRYVQMDPPHSNNTFSAMLVKYDANGLLKWYTSALDHPGRYLLNDDGNGGVLLVTGGYVRRYSPAGTLLWTINNDNGDAAIDGDGNIWVTSSLSASGPIVRKFDPSGGLLFTGPEVPSISDLPTVRLNQNQLLVGPGGDLFLAGTYYGAFVIGNDTLRDEHPEYGHYSAFVLRMNAQGEVLWVRSIKSGDWITIDGMVLRDSLLAVLMKCPAGTTVTGNCPPLQLTDVGHCTYTVDVTGADARLDQLIQDFELVLDDTWWTREEHNLLDLDGMEDFRAALTYDTVVTYAGNTIAPYMPFGPGSLCFTLLDGSSDCFFPHLPSPTATPVSYFTADGPVCAFAPLQLQDASLNAPTTWLWDMPGAVPSTSTEADPIVTYSGPGTYAITLVASNANGTGTTYTGSVSIDVCTGNTDPEPSTLRVYPVPADAALHVETGPGSGAMYGIRDIAGREVERGRLSGTPSVIATAQLANGRYELRVWDTKGTHTCSFLVHHR